ncbi:MAG TPA: 3-dehydroquinate synthase, partial [Janibacter terrae]|nr:3-dehydroquinate synthase [Janibacter terrae]
MSDVSTIPVGDDYDVLVGHGVSSRVTEVLPKGVARVLVVHGAPLARLAEPVVTALRDAGLEVHV